VLDALRDRRYRQLWLAGLAANTARGIDLVVLSWVALALTDSPFMVGVAAFARSIPMVTLGPFAGIIADRLRPARILVAVQTINVVATLALTLLFARGLAGFVWLVAMAAVLGVGWAMDFPARRTALYALVGRERIADAISLDTIAQQLAKLGGPLAAGALLAQLGPAGGYGALALLHLAALFLLRGLDPHVNPPARLQKTRVGASLAAGLAEAWAHPLIRGVLSITVIMNVLVFPYQPMLPVYARDVLRVGPEGLGLLFAAGGLGALSGSLLFAVGRDRGQARVFAGGSAFVVVALLGFAASPWYGLSLVLQFLIGIGEAGFANMQSTIVLLAASEASRGRALGILSACIGTQPFGTLLIGFLTGRVGPPAATALLAVVALGAMARPASRMTGLRLGLSGRLTT
jgi:MFS family permease